MESKSTIADLITEACKRFLAGLAGFAAVALVGWTTYALWPYSGFVWGSLFFVGFCIALGSDLRQPPPRHGRAQR